MSELSPDFVQQLETRFGSRFSVAQALREQHSGREAHHHAALPDAVIFAENTEEVAAIVRLCAAARVPVIPFGAGTSLEGHLSAVKGGVSIDLSRMNQVLRVSQPDLDCTVQPGVTREQLNQYSHDKGLFFPIDPGANASIGGMVSTRASGTNAVRYGTMRENTLALKLVLPDGQIIHTGSRARKSSAGYDLTRLFTGAEGTLGVITEITLRLYGIPEVISAAVCSFASIEQAVDTAITVIQLGIPVARMELMDRAQIKAVNAYSGLTLAEEDTLAFEFHGSSVGVQDQIAMVKEIVAEQQGRDFIWAESAEERNKLWQARHKAYYAALALRPGAKGWSSDVCVPISALSDSIRHTRKLLEKTNIPTVIVGHVGDGNYHVLFVMDPSSPQEAAEVAAINKEIVHYAISVGGTCTGEHGVGLGKVGYMREEHGDAVDLMRRLKNAIDPDGIMNPGKILPPL